MYIPNRLQSHVPALKIGNEEIQTVQKISERYDLKCPEEFKAASKKGHCLAICLNFIKNYLDSTAGQASERGRQVVKEMKLTLGANESCAKTSAIYEGLFSRNCHQKETTNTDLLSSLRGAVANTLGLHIAGQIELHGSIEEIQNYLTTELEDGEYVIPLPSHLVTLVKKGSEIILLNPGGRLIEMHQGLIESETELFKFLVKSRVAITESLSLSKVERSTQNQGPHQPKKVILSDTASMESTLHPIKGEAAWGKREISWRGKKYFFIQHIPSGNIYNGNSKILLRTKFIILASGRTLVEMVARIIYHSAMFIFRSFLCAVLKCTGKGDLDRLKLQTIQSFLDIFRSAIYGTAMLGVSFYGVYNPYEGRRYYQKLESTLNRGQSVKEKWHTAPCFIPLAANGDWKNRRLVRHIGRLNHAHLFKKNNCHYPTFKMEASARS